jgi:hypothetical protein
MAKIRITLTNLREKRKKKPTIKLSRVVTTMKKDMETTVKRKRKKITTMNMQMKLTLLSLRPLLKVEIWLLV